MLPALQAERTLSSRCAKRRRRAMRPGMAARCDRPLRSDRAGGNKEE